MPRLRSVVTGKVPLQSYQQMKKAGQFSEELLLKCLGGLSARKYEETVLNSAQAFGVSPSSVSRQLIEITTKKLK